MQKHSAIGVVAALSASTMVACADPVRPRAAKDDSRVNDGLTLSSVAARSSKQPRVAHASIDEQFKGIARDAPGFGGLFLDEDGTPTIYLTDVEKRGPALSAVGRVFGSVAGVRGKSIRVRVGRYDFAELSAWRDSIAANLPFDDIVFLDASERDNRVVIGVADPSAIAGLSDGLRNSGIPHEAVIFEKTQRRALQSDLAHPVRPMIGALAISKAPSFQRCTLGFNARIDHIPAYDFFVTNSHCTNIIGTTWDQTSFYQPFIIGGVPDTGYVGLEYLDPQFFNLAYYPGCPVDRVCRYSDSALGVYKIGTAVSQYSIAKTLSYTRQPQDGYIPGSSTIAPDPFVVVGEASEASLVVGQLVSKIGSSTGWTEAPISRTCVTESLVANEKTLLCQYEAAGYSLGGDSGSPVFIRPGTGNPNEVLLAGILFSGCCGLYGFSSIYHIQLELGTLRTYASAP
jgi:hypothetical protein